MKGILTYHSIDPSGSAISLDEETFERHLDWLASGRVRVSTIAELLHQPSEAPQVALTFDDAFENFATRAWPALRERGLPVTLFVPTDHVGGTNTWSGEPEAGIPTMPLLDWGTLARLVEEGVVIGSHGRSHRDLRLLGESDLTDELRGAAERIAKETGQRPDVFAYPYGLLDDRVATAASEVYSFACTADLRVLRPVEDMYRLPRLDAYYFQRPGALESWGSRRFRAHVWLRSRARRLRQSLRALHRPR